MVRILSPLLFNCATLIFSPISGQLPYLEHGSRRVASVPTIVAYLSTLSPSATLPTPLSAAESENGDRTEKSDSASLGKGEDLDKGLSKSQRAEMIAWRSVIQGELADLTVRFPF